MSNEIKHDCYKESVKSANWLTDICKWLTIAVLSLGKAICIWVYQYDIHIQAICPL